MDRSELENRTDVTTIGYGVGDFNAMVSDQGVKITRVCVEGPEISRALLAGFRTSVVVGFPFGNPSRREIEEVLIAGAQEIDIPIPLRLVGAGSEIRPNYFMPPIKLRDWLLDLKLPPNPALVYKFILHSDVFQKYYGPKGNSVMVAYADAIGDALQIKNGPQLVMKTCTGYGPGGAEPSMVEVLKKKGYRVKASGKIRTKDQVLTLINSGADLLGIGYPAYREIWDSW